MLYEISECVIFYVVIIKIKLFLLCINTIKSKKKKKAGGGDL